MVINELLKMVAKLFGFEVSSQPVNVSASIGADDLASDLGTAGKKAKELKAQLMGFDEINNINLDNDISSGGGSSSGGVGGIDQRLLDALKGYDNLMDSVSNKATEIRDKMLDWLGFKRNDDGTWKLKEGLTNFEKILDVVKLIGLAIGTWKISSTITNVLKNLGILKGKQNFQLAFGLTLTLTGIMAQWQGTSHLLNGDVDLFTILETLMGTAGGALGIVNMLKATKLGKKLSLGNKLKVGFGIMLGIQGVQVFLDGISEGDIKKTLLGAFEGITSLSVAFNGLFGKKLTTSIKNTIASIATFGISTVSYFKDARASGLSLGKSLIQTGKDALNLVPTSVKVTTGIIGLGTSFVTAYSSMEKFKEGSISTGEAVAQTGMSIAGAAASGAMLGSVIPGIGTVLGALIGAIGGTISSLIGLSSATDEYTYDTSELKKEIDSLTESYKNNKKSIEDNAIANEAELTYAENLKVKLGEMIETNGKVKEGYQERAKIVLGELSSALGQEYTMTDDNIYINGKLVKSYNEIEESINKTIEAKRKEIELEATKSLLTEAIKQEAKARQEVAKAQENLNEKIAKYNENPWNLIDANAVNEAKDALEEAQNTLNDASEDVQIFSKDFTDKMVQTTGEFSAQMIEQGEISKSTLQSIAKENSTNFLTELNKIDEGNQALYLSMATTADNLSPELIQKWKELGEKSEGEYLGSLSPLPADVQATILSSITTIDNMNDGMKMAWSNLALKGKEEFNNALMSLDEDVQGEILASVIAVTGMTETTKTAYYNLSDNAKKAFNEALDGMDTDAKNKVQSAIDEINGKKEEAGIASGKVGSEAAEKFKTNLGDTEKAVNNWISPLKTKLQAKDPFGVIGLIGSFGSLIVKRFDKSLGNASPSKKTKKSATNFMAGFSNNIKKIMPNTLAQIGQLASGLTNEFDNNLKLNNILNGFKIDSQDFKVDTTQFIDYGAISGNINTQTKVDIRDLPQEVKQAVIEGISQVSIPIEIEARTDEGVIFKKVQVKAREYEMQTGQPAFEF